MIILKNENYNRYYDNIAKFYTIEKGEHKILNEILVKNRYDSADKYVLKNTDWTKNFSHKKWNNFNLSLFPYANLKNNRNNHRVDQNAILKLP